MNIKSIELDYTSEGGYFTKEGKTFQIYVSEKYFEIYDNKGNEVVSFKTKDIKNIMKRS